MTNVVVAGGGIAGLAAAWALAGHGHHVTVVEPDVLGGKIRTSPFAGRNVDEGADAFLARVPEAVTLAHALGMDRELVAPAALPAYVWSDEDLRRIPAEQLLGVPTDLHALAKSGLCSAAGIERAEADLFAPAEPLPEDVSVGALVRARLGDEIMDRLVDPLVGGINAGNADELSLAVVAPALDAAARSGEPSLVRAAAAARTRAAQGVGPAPRPVFLAPRRGMQVLVDALVHDLAGRGATLRVGARVHAIEPGKRWTVSIGAPGVDRGLTVEADAVVLATPAPVAARLLRPVAPAAASELAEVAYASVALVTLAFTPGDVHRALDGSGFLVPRDEHRLVTACSWSSTKWPHLAPEHGDGTIVMRASVGRIDDRRFEDMDDAALTDAVVRDLEAISGVSGAPRAVRVARWTGAFPQYAVGHRQRIASVTQTLRDRAPGIALAGAALEGVGIPTCIRTGLAAAEAVTDVAR